MYFPSSCHAGQKVIGLQEEEEEKKKGLCCLCIEENELLTFGHRLTECLYHVSQAIVQTKVQLRPASMGMSKDLGTVLTIKVRLILNTILDWTEQPNVYATLVLNVPAIRIFITTRDLAFYATKLSTASSHRGIGYSGACLKTPKSPFLYVTKSTFSIYLLMF